MKTRNLAICSVLALFLALGALPARAADYATKTKCDLTFSLTEWAAVYKHASGTGTITCDNGKTIPVTITSKGGGLTAGKYRIEGHGEFTAVPNAYDLLGGYGALEANAGVIKSGATTVLTKGDVSLALAGKGEGWNVGISLGKLTLSERR
ncbi:MAG TPA: hypothetical protein VOA87_13470 [Thermoanaerobaculia bacterium]|nr:hypothetical protein [Thermoanaerobaculia bacterium]